MKELVMKTKIIVTEIERIRRVITQRDRTTVQIEIISGKGIENNIVGTRGEESYMTGI